jgi:ATP-dependent Clp protease ATP-binding subunit ClpE
MLCTKCKKNRAVIFVKRIEGGNQFDEGYCFSCAKKLGIAPVNDMLAKMGMSEEEMEAMESQLDEAMQMLENGDIPEELQNMLPMFDGMNIFEGMMPGNSGDESEGEAEPEKGTVRTKTKDKKKNKKRLIDTYGTNLNEKAVKGEIDRIIGREKEIQRVIQILNRRAKNNPALIGEPGVGKTAVAEGLALKIVEKKVPEKLLDKQVYLIDFTALVAGTQFRGQFEARVKGIIDEVKSLGNVILVIDEVHNIVGGGGNDGALSAANIMKPALARGEIQVIGATTLSEYRKYIEKDAALERRFQPVIVEEPTPQETIEIIKGIRDYYEEHHKIVVSDDIIKQAVVLSKRFIQGRFLPDKAIDVIDEAGSAANLKNETLTKLTILKRKLKEIEEEKENAVSTDSIEDYQRAADLKSRECMLKDEISSLEQICENTVITSEDIANVVEMWTNVPVKKLTQDESEKLTGLENVFKKSIIGQDDAANKVAAAIRRKRAGIELKMRPASFLFVGPTGVGKTEFVKVMAESLFGSRDELVVLDMTEYQEQHSVSKMIGSPPGYVGYEEAGQLTEKVRRKPYCVILFDEIEKAHPSVYNILLQILDEGRLTDSQGRNVSFENTVIVLTSNAGIGFGTEALGFSPADESDEKKAFDKLQQIFKPELLNRIDEIIAFNKLKPNDFKQICKLIVSELERAILEKGITLSITDEALTEISNK